MGVPLIEQETVITYGRLDDEAEIYTSDSVMIGRLDKKVKNFPDCWKVKETGTVDGIVVSRTYICPKKLVSLRNQRNPQGGEGNSEALKRYREQQNEHGDD